MMKWFNDSAINLVPNNLKCSTFSFIQAMTFTSDSPLFFLSTPSLLWPSETGGELTPSVPGAWGSEAVLDVWEWVCSWYKRFLSFSSKVLMVQSTKSTLRRPSLSDSPGPVLPGCWWLEDWELWEVWCAGLWGWEVTVPGCMAVA